MVWWDSKLGLGSLDSPAPLWRDHYSDEDRESFVARYQDQFQRLGRRKNLRSVSSVLIDSLPLIITWTVPLLITAQDWYMTAPPYKSIKEEKNVDGVVVRRISKETGERAKVADWCRPEPKWDSVDLNADTIEEPPVVQYEADDDEPYVSSGGEDEEELEEEYEEEDYGEELGDLD